MLSMTLSTMAGISGLHPYYFVAIFKKIKCKFLFHFFSYFWLFRIRKEKEKFIAYKDRRRNANV